MSKERAWCQADGGAAESPPPGLLPAINNPPARQAELCTQQTLPMPGAGPGGLPPGAHHPARPPNPVPPGAQPPTAKGTLQAGSGGASPGEGHLPALPPSPRGTPLRVWAALPAHVVCTKSTAERHRFLVNMFLLSETREGPPLWPPPPRLPALRREQAREASGPRPWHGRADASITQAAAWTSLQREGPR